VLSLVGGFEVNEPMLRMPRAALEKLVGTLEVQFVKLAECVVSPGWRITLDGSDAPAIHYNIGKTGVMLLDGHEPVELKPHTLVIVPAGRSFSVEGFHDTTPSTAIRTVEGNAQTFAPGSMRRFVAGTGVPQVLLICGYFQATFGACVELFAGLSAPIVEHFDSTDSVDRKLTSALDELMEQEVGAGAMTAALLKQVLVMLLRRSLSSNNQWVERFSILGDPQIAQAFAEMASAPGAAHTVPGLAKEVGLSRSIFIERFGTLFGRPPGEVLRELRMRRAAQLLAGNARSIDLVANDVGYANRSSFMRAFRKSYGVDPSAYRATARSPVAV
jgi:AraC family transcriptional regulator, activator of mtrCDE